MSLHWPEAGTTQAVCRELDKTCVCHLNERSGGQPTLVHNVQVKFTGDLILVQQRVLDAMLFAGGPNLHGHPHQDKPVDHCRHHDSRILGGQRGKSHRRRGACKRLKARGTAGGMGAGCAGTGSDEEPVKDTFARLGQGLRADGTHTNPNPNSGESSPPLFQSSWSKQSINKGQSNILAYRINVLYLWALVLYSPNRFLTSSPKYSSPNHGAPLRLVVYSVDWAALPLQGPHSLLHLGGRTAGLCSKGGGGRPRRPRAH